MNIGFIGIGLMGRRITGNLLRGGHNLTVFDARRAAADELLSQGATWAASPRAVAAASEVVFTALPRPRDVENVSLGASGILSGAAPDLAYFDLSTTDPDTIQRIATAARPRGVHVLDAPVSGGTIGAEQAQLTIMIGGNRDVCERYRTVLEVISNRIIYCGEQGTGAVCKIVNNLLNLGNYLLLAEALTLGRTAGVDTETLFEAISHSSGNSRSLQEFPDSLFVGNFEPGFRLDLGAKDVGLATEMGREYRVPMEVANLVEQRFQDALNRGWGGQSAVSVMRLQEERTKMDIRV